MKFKIEEFEDLLGETVNIAIVRVENTRQIPHNLPAALEAHVQLIKEN